MRQYNKDKPQKFRVDFFILCNNTPEQYFIVHCDVYQGRNDVNINVPKELQGLPMTQKAVANAIVQANLGP